MNRYSIMPIAGARRTLAPALSLTLITALGTATSGCAELDAAVRAAAHDVQALFDSESSGAKDPAHARADDAYARARRAGAAGDHGAEIAGLREAAELGHPRAAYELGIAYSQGRGVPVDLETGAMWINRSADAGDPNAEFLVGSSLYGGVGVTRDVPEGIAWLERAGEQGHPRAQFLLGQTYVDGTGVTKDPAWAARWYGQAALAGHAQAQYAYGVMFATGLGVPRDVARAYEWLSLAKAGGEQRASPLLGKLAGELTPEAIAAADARARHIRYAPSSGFDNAPTIVYVQERLRALGFRVGPADGIAGPLTRAAIRAYQTRSRLDVDGEISQALIEQLRWGAGG